MDQSIYNRNMKIIKKRWPDYYDRLKCNSSASDIKCVLSDQGGKIIPIVYVNESAYTMDSIYSFEPILDSWVNLINLNVYELNMFMFGLGNGMYVRRFIKEVGNKKKFKIIVYEPDTVIIKECIRYYDMTDLFDDERMELLIQDDNKYMLSDYIFNNIDYYNVDQIHTGFYLNYPHIYNEQKEFYDKELIMVLEKIKANQLTTNLGGELYYRFTKRNYKSLIESYSLNSLKDVLPKDIPAIVVSSGPSLTKNIKELNNAKGRSFILAVDSSLGEFDKAGIVPDMYISIDPEKHESNFTMDWVKDVPVIGALTSADYIYKDGQIKYMTYIFDTFISRFIAKQKPLYKQWDLRAGGSVANVAFKLVQILGFKRIILVGQDLAYTNDKAHADNVSYDDDTIDSGDIACLTADIYGNLIKSNKKMEMYKSWFEDQISKNPEWEVIDATEGGALIKGTTVMTLKDAIKLWCGNKRDIKKCFDNCELMFSDEQKKELTKYIDSVPDRMKEIIRNAEKLLSNYFDMEDLVKRDKESSGGMKRLLSENKALTEQVENNPAYCYIDYLNGEEMLKVESNFNKVDDDVKKDILNICTLGKSHIKGVLKAADIIANDYKHIWECTNEEI